MAVINAKEMHRCKSDVTDQGDSLFQGFYLQKSHSLRMYYVFLQLRRDSFSTRASSRAV